MYSYLAILLFFLPAGIANSFPPVANKIPVLNTWKTPLDFGNKFRGQRVFGKNKTWRGLVGGAFIGGLTSFVLWGLTQYSEQVWLTSRIDWFFIGAVLGAGALVGDAVESFFKRQIGIKSGDSWLFFDQIDYVAGAILFSLPFVRFSLREYAFLIAVYFGLHFVVSYCGYLLGFKEKPI